VRILGGLHPRAVMVGRVYVASVDGSPSASNSDPESFERTTPSRRSDPERELYELRARAYGPKPDIEADPVAIARLIELEAARVAAMTPDATTESVGSRAADASPSAPPGRESVPARPTPPEAKPMIPTSSRESFGWRLWQRATATRSRARFIVGSIVVVAILVSAATWLLPRPDAMLRPTAGELDTRVMQAMNGERDAPDVSTFRQFEPYHDIDVWSVQSVLGNACLIAFDSVGSGRFQFQCLPPGIELALHMPVDAAANDGFGEWLPDGSVISLHLRDNTVDVFVHAPSAAT
jgi:hypothetical protein